MCSHDAQNLVEGLKELDPHIGGDDLHRLCYDQLQACWLEWSGGYHVPIEKTTLRGDAIHAAIAGKGLRGPAAKRDTILGCFMKQQQGKKAGEKVFRSSQLDLAVVIDAVDYKCAMTQRERIYDLDEDGLVIGHKVGMHNLMFIDVSRSCTTSNRSSAADVSQKHPIRLI